MDEANPDYVKIMGYVDHNPATVLSTVDGDGRPQGAVIFVCTASNNTLCFVTKTGTKKYHDLTAHPDVSLTFFNERESSTLQAAGRAYVAADNTLVDYVFDKLKKAHAMQADWLPPVTKVQEGEYAVIGIELSWMRLSEFGGMGVGGPTVTEVKA